MKASLMALVVALATYQAAQVPQAVPQAGQRGQAPAPLSAAECKCSIEVTVKHGGTGEPISDVDVTLTYPIANALTAAQFNLPPEQFAASQVLARGTTNTTQTATTDNSGRAVFRDLAEGNYNVSAQATGYFGIANDAFPTQATAAAPVGPAVAQAGARGTPRQPIQQISLNLVKGSIIAGRITDANRRPASGTQVGAYRVNYQNGNRTLTSAASTVQADDRGEFRLFWLPPGEYYVRAEAPRITVVAAASSYPNVTYYPGTLDPKEAVRVVVRDGSEVNGTNFALQSANGVTISGTIVNTITDAPAGPRGQPNRSVSTIVLVPRNAYFSENPPLISNTQSALRANQTNDSETGFEIKNVPPGTYDFYPIYSSGAPLTAGGGSLPGYYSGRTPVEVGSENVTGIRSVIQPGASLKVHVNLSGTAPNTGPRGNAQPLALANLRPQIRLKENAPILLTAGSLTQSSAPDADGVIMLANILDGSYYVNGMSGLPVDAFVSDIRIDSRSVFDENLFTVAKNSQSTLEVTVTRGGGTIQGFVLDAKHVPVSGARITLIPDPPRRQNTLLYKTAIANAMGAFNLNGVAPGNYKLFGWEKNPAGAEQDPEFMREYDLLGTSVNVSLGIPLANIQVSIIPAKR